MGRVTRESVSAEEFSRRFRIALRDVGLSPYKAAKALAVAKGTGEDRTAYLYARGARTPGLNQLLLMVDVLQLNPRILVPELFGQEHDDEPS